MTIKRGCTRWVVLTGKYALKFPRCHNYNFAFGYLDSLCKGIIQNINEYRLFKAGHTHLCPVVFCVWGFCNVMLRAKELTDTEFGLFEGSIRQGDLGDREIAWVLAEHKADSWGWLNNEIVAIDYGDKQ